MGIDMWTDGKINSVFAIWRYGDVLWPRGELLLVATVIGADAAGGLIASDGGDSQILKSLKLVSAGGCILLSLASAWWYQKIQENGSHLTDRIVTGSAAILIVTIVVSFVCKMLAED